MSLRDRADKEVQQHNAEMKELIRVIDHDRRLRGFMNAKSKEREEDQQLVAWRLRKGLSAPHLQLTFVDLEHLLVIKMR